MPVPSRIPGWLAAGALAVWYGFTAARGLLWFDGGELATVGHQLGLGHPPGQPLYTLLLGALSRLPGIGGDPDRALLAMNLLSALTAALCAVPADAVLRRVATVGPGIRFSALICAGVVAPVWDQATRIELYAPTTLIVLTTLAAGLRVVEDRDGGRALAWLGLGLLVGVGGGFNPVLALSGGLAIGLYAVPSLFRRGATALGVAIGAAFVGALIGSAGYLYFWWLREQPVEPPRLIWGELDTITGVWNVLRGADYGHTDHTAFDRVVPNLVSWMVWMGRHGALAVFAFGLVGWLAAQGGRRRLIVWLLPVSAGFAFSMTYRVYYPQVPDFNGYLMPAFWLCAAGLGALASTLRPVLARLAIGVALVTALVSVERPVWTRTRAGLDTADALAGEWLTSMPADGVLIVGSDHLVFPLLFAQEIRGFRRDVVLINEGWAASGWYWRYLYRRHPSLARIPLSAPDTGTRLRRLLLAERTRPARVESMAIAGRVGIRPCPATWGLALGQHCAAARDDPAIFAKALRRWWSGPAVDDAITPRVLARLTLDRAEGLWGLGDGVGAMKTLRAGLPPGVGEGLPVPPELIGGTRLPQVGPRLIGHPAAVAQTGARILHQRGFDVAAAAWGEVAEVLAMSWQ